jgi:hypothetical protein
MKDWIGIGCTPSDEDCVQVSPQESYSEAMTVELLAFKHQLERLFAPELPSNRFGIKYFQHDFGQYGDVVCYYDDSIEESAEFAFDVEGKVPEKWDSVALTELRQSKAWVDYYSSRERKDETI